MKQFLSALGMVIVGACWTDAALASPIAFHFGGSVTSVDPLLTGTFAVGDPISDILTFDPAAVDTDPNPATGRYQYISFQLQFGSYVASSLPGVNSIISVFNQPSFDLFQDRKSTRLNSSHLGISYAVFCLKKKNTQLPPAPLGRAGGAADLHGGQEPQRPLG